MTEGGLALESFPRLAPGVRLKFDETRQQWIVLAPERVLVPDETALEVLQRCDGATRLDALIDDLARSYDADRGEITTDVQELLNGLIEKRLLTI
ncbi:MAG TPA: pyrroloquinoline quinone biosynthesis peptide chaperone PqqD [Candidatus Binatia bacterium]|nr:pyrroloquinoline quinone biosynthesis peptide chaperone PqqD [Candidatus Binatia bacterium]